MKITRARIPLTARTQRASPAALETLLPDVPWVRLGEEVLLFTHDGASGDMTALTSLPDVTVDEYPATTLRENLHLVVQQGRIFQQRFPDVPVMVDKGRYLVVDLPPTVSRALADGESSCFAIEPFADNQVVFETRAATPRAERAPESWVQALTDKIDRASFEATLTHLVSFPTRHSTSTHFANAALWAESRFSALGYSVRRETISVDGGSSQNVVADQPGAETGTRELVIVAAHLDSINVAGGASASAPGADDNGSGSAGVLEMAAAFSGHPGLHDLRFILFGGEEQGLHGSEQYVATLTPGERSRISAVVNMDMIGSQNTGEPTVLLEGATVSQSVIDGLAAAAGDYTGLAVQTSLSPFASDHVPFIDAGLPAVLTIEGADGANTAIHSAADTLDRITYDLALDILRMNTAFAATRLGNQETPPCPA